MKYIGVWLDKEKAHLVTLENEKEMFKTLESEVEFFHPKGGSRSKSKWGPQDVVQDSKYTEREKHQLKAFFERIAGSLKNPQAIALFGPGNTYAQFHKWLEDNRRDLAQKAGTVQKADSMTHNQFKALVREVFGMSPDRSL
ncbi:MAG: hypothetical protein KJP14_01545 [Eudoraea sp.]|nr:hypothetical protein [Eudoraea sp.]NNJ39136.1 hypothetical protein [Flavobacteriaceae bacterium]MBT8204864.1 hypothetical protein [Eudoraea sp.]MBT8209188.1 hypothetical protein [Eudoraea sp.]MBT8312720.1 hypothetical protein [Eudoraea sp.]